MDFIEKLDEWELFDSDYTATDDERSELLKLAGQRSKYEHPPSVWHRLKCALLAHGGKTITDKTVGQVVSQAKVSAILGGFPTDATNLIELWTDSRKIVCRHNGMITSELSTMVLDSGRVVPVEASDLADPAVCQRIALTRRDITVQTLYNELFLFTRQHLALKRFSESELRAAVEVWAPAARAARVQVMYRDISRPFDADTTAAQLRAAVEANFETSSDYPAEFYEAAIKKFIHQVKRKMLGLPVEDHLMIVLLGVQGIGKTTLVRKICEPLLETFRSVKFDQIADQRYAMELSKSFILFVDEMAGAKKAEMNTVKTLISDERSDTRPLGRNDVISLEQKATLIGTSNDDMDQLIRDKTGNRRFAGLMMRSNPNWAALNAVDWCAVWSSVDPAAADPLKAFNGQLKALQGSQRSKTSVEVWYELFDPTEYNYLFLRREANDDGWVTAAYLHSVFRQWEDDHYPRQFATELIVWGRQLSKLIAAAPKPIFEKGVRGHAKRVSYRYLQSVKENPGNDIADFTARLEAKKHGH